MTTYRVPVALGDLPAAAKFLQNMQPVGTSGFPIPFLTVAPPEQFFSQIANLFFGHDWTCEKCAHLIESWSLGDPHRMFSASIPADYVRELPGTPRHELAALVGAVDGQPRDPLYPYQVMQVCDHLGFIYIPDTAAFILRPIVEATTVLDQESFAEVLSASVDPDEALADMAATIVVDEVTRAQMTALGFDPDDAEMMRALMLDATKRTRSHAPKPDGLTVEEAIWSISLGGHLGHLEWTVTRAARLSDFSATYLSRRVDDVTGWDETRLLRADGRLVVQHDTLRDGHQEAAVAFDAPYDTRPEYQDRYQHGETISTGPWWRPRPEEFTAHYAAFSVTAPRPTPDSALTDTATVADGRPLTGHVYGWTLRANPWTGTRFWVLDLQVVVGDDGHPTGPSVKVICPHADGQRIREGDVVTFESITMRGHATP